MATEDPSWMATLLAGVAALASSFGAALFGMTNHRIGKLEGKIDTKADKSTVDGHRTDVNNIWTELRDLRQDMNDRHVELLNAIIHGKK